MPKLTFHPLATTSLSHSLTLCFLLLLDASTCICKRRERSPGVSCPVGLLNPPVRHPSFFTAFFFCPLVPWRGEGKGTAEATCRGHSAFSCILEGMGHSFFALGIGKRMRNSEVACHWTTVTGSPPLSPSRYLSRKQAPRTMIYDHQLGARSERMSRFPVLLQHHRCRSVCTNKTLE